ncbi:MAG: bifunctional diguanylate cyclase/phosphodiesterase [Bacillales bacterium]|nr:bifunctional diguanylate cyclase/phosphodiesterase [Bacillales bacterium]
MSIFFAENYEDMLLSLKKMTSHDPLTRLRNRNTFMEDLNSWIDCNGGMFAVFCMDLDSFQKMNDALGHRIGDKVLEKTAKRLQEVIGKHGTVYRVGGDEFAALVKIGEKREPYIQLAQQIMEAIGKKLEVEEYEVFITTSMGLSFYPNDGEDPDTLFQTAEVALSRAKELGKNNCQIYASSMKRSTFKMYHLEKELRKALKNDGLSIEYQPRIEASTNQIVGAEALLRWHHPEWGTVLPSEFIPLAEEGGLINEIGDWVIGKVCEQIHEWQSQNIEVPTISINISPKRFLKKGLYETLLQATAGHHVEPSQLEMEITELSLLLLNDLVLEQWRKIQNLGVRIALDDFGTGYSSINSLRKYPIDTLKIDRSFIQYLEQNGNDRAIIKALIEMAHAMGTRVVAEGVETKSQLQFLQQCHCDEIQGFLFSKSLPSKEIEQLFIQKTVLPQDNSLSEKRKNFQSNQSNPFVCCLSANKNRTNKR